MDSKLLKVLARQLEEEALELDTDIYAGTHSNLLLIAKILKGLAEEEDDE